MAANVADQRAMRPFLDHDYASPTSARASNWTIAERTEHCRRSSKSITGLGRQHKENSIFQKGALA
jgi:hypothetical protein